MYLSYADALAETTSEGIKAIVRRRKILYAGVVARMGEERLPQRVMFPELVGSKGCSEGMQMASTSRGGSRVVHAELA